MLRRSIYGVLTLTNLSCMVVGPKIVNRIILQEEKVQVSPFIRSFRQSNRNSKGSEKKWKISEGRRG